MSWNKDDLSQYNNAESPHFSVSHNGKVDIGLKIGEDKKYPYNLGVYTNYLIVG